MERQSNDGPVCGELETPLGLNGLASRLRTLGVATQVRDSSHYEGGRYLLVGDAPGHLTFEAIAAGEYLVEGDGDSISQVQATASPVSRALADLQIRHRFEIYDLHDEMVEYLHHQWPRPADA